MFGKLKKIIQPTQTNKTLKESIESVKEKNKSISKDTFILQYSKEKGYYYQMFDIQAFDSTKKYSQNKLNSKENSFKTEQEATNWLDSIIKEFNIINKTKEHASQALINTKIAALKEVAKKYPRTLIRSEVKATKEYKSSFDTVYQKLPSKEELVKQNEVSFTFKAIKIITDNLIKINNWFKQLKDTDQFWNKLQKDLQIPKEQLELLKNSEGNTIEDKLLDFVSKYSYTVEINTAKVAQGSIDEGFERIDGREEGQNTATYSNLTVNEEFYKNNPDWEYKEQRITTPLIIPSIKGHAQFAESNDIGWFRAWYNKKTGEVHVLEVQSDLFQKSEKEIFSLSKYYSDYYKIPEFYTINGRFWHDIKTDTYYKGKNTVISKEEFENAFKDRALERVQELKEFYNIVTISKIDNNEYEIKTREIKNTIKSKLNIKDIDFRIKNIKKELSYSKEYVKDNFKDIYEVLDYSFNEFYSKRIQELNDRLDKEENLKSNYILEENQNQFLQLLNKDNNWVTFFIKSIIQDSAKKGYEKVLFPSGNTAGQIENFIQKVSKYDYQKITSLEKSIENAKKEPFKKSIQTRNFEEGNKKVIALDFKDGTEIIIRGNSKEEAEKNFENNLNIYLEKNNQIINKFETELSRLKNVVNSPNYNPYEFNVIEGIDQDKARSVVGFYENTVTNILKKQGFSPVVITDEYGNTWNEIKIKPEFNDTILFQVNELDDFNDKYKSDIFSDSISLSKRITQLKLNEKYPNLRFTKHSNSNGTARLIAYDKKGNNFQLENANLPSNREVNIRLKNLLAKIGITLEEVEESLTINGEKVSGIAYADLFRKVIQYVNGKTDGTMLPEEAAHIFTLLMKKNDPLRNAMIKNIKSLQTYSDVRNNPKYQSKFGDNEDLYVMEAIGQVIMQRMMGIPVAKKEAWVQTWWNNLVNLVKTLLNGGVDAELSSLLKPFDEVKDKMLANETSDLMSLDEFAEENKNKQFQLFQVDNEVNPIENTINKLGEFTIVGDKAVDKDGKEYELADDLRVANKKLKFDILNQLRAIRGMSYEPITVDANKLASLDKITNELNNEINTIYGDDVTVITDQLYYDSETNKVKKVDLLFILPDGSVDIKMIEAVNENKKYGVSVKYYDKFNKNLTSIKKYLTRNSIISRSIKIQPIKIIVSKTKIKDNVAKSFDLGLDSYYLTNGIYYKNGVAISKDIYELNEADPMMVNTSHEENYTAPEINNENVEYSEFTTVDNPTKADTDIENKKNTKLIETLKYRLLTIEQSKLDSKVKAEAKKRVLLTISQLLTKNNYSSLINTTLADLRNIKKELKDMNPLDLRNSKDFVLFAKSLSSVHKLKDKINSSDLEAEDKKDYIHNINDINDLCDDILETIDSIIKVKNTQTSGIVGTNLESDADSLIGVNDIKDTNERNKLIKSSNLDFMMDWTDRMLATFRQNMSKNKWINTFIKLLDKQNDEILEENTKFADKLQEFKDKLGDTVIQLINPKTKNLIRHFSEEFRLQSGIANKKRDWKWFVDNTTKKSNYKEIYDEMFEKEKNRLDSLNLNPDEYDYSLIKFRKLYDIDSDIYKKEAYLNAGTRMLFLDTNEEWYSDEYKALSPELKEFYTFWSTIMNRGAYILDERSNIKGNTIPNISKKLAETVFVDGKFDMKLMFAGLKFTGESKGRLNPITDEIEYTIPKYFIDSLLEKDGEEKSMDLYKSLMMFQAMVNNYEKKSEIEGQVLALQAGISDEKVLKKVNNQWLAIKDETNANLSTFMDYMNWAMYDVTNKNEDSKITGTELSTQKVIKGVKNLSVKANLSLNTFSIVANFLGNEYNIAIESAKGIAFTKKTWKDSQLMYANIFDRQEALGFLELLELDKKDELKKKINNLSINNIVRRYDNANSLFVQHFVENAGRNKIALAMALNHTVNEDGKIVRITEKTQKNLIELGVINENNEYNLNVDLKELNKFKRKVQHEIGIITGFSSEDDINAIKLSTMGDLVSTYRGWIPKMAAARFGDLKYNDVIDEWTIGRYKSMASYILNDKISNTLDTLLNVIPFVTTLKGDSYEARLIQYAKLDFVKQMQKNPKLTLEDEQAYIDAYVGNMKANLMELKVTLGILITLLMLGGYDDDDKDKNRKYLIKIMKRSYSELSFFYNPFGFTDILKSPIPGTNYITNNLQMLKDVVLEIKGNLTDDEKLIKQAKPLHRFSKNIKYLSGAVNTIDSYIED